MAFFIPLCRSIFPPGIIFLPKKILLPFLPDEAFISSSFLKWRTIILNGWTPSQVKLPLAPAQEGSCRPGAVPELKRKERWLHGERTAERCGGPNSLVHTYDATTDYLRKSTPKDRWEWWPLLTHSLSLQTKLGPLLIHSVCSCKLDWKTSQLSSFCLSYGNLLALD